MSKREAAGGIATHRNNGLERLESQLANLVAGLLVGDVLDELGEVCDLEKLIGSNQLESLDAGVLQACGESPVGERATSELEDLLHGSGVEVGEAICQWEGKRSSHGDGSCCEGEGDS